MATLDETLEAASAHRNKSPEDIRSIQLVFSAQLELGKVQVARAAALETAVPAKAIELLTSAMHTAEALQEEYPGRIDLRARSLGTAAALTDAYLASGDPTLSSHWAARCEDLLLAPDGGAPPDFQWTLWRAELAMRLGRIAHGRLNPSDGIEGMPYRTEALGHLERAGDLLQGLLDQGLGGHHVASLAAEAKELALSMN